ncbi:acyl-CoA carboxylase epsilon subunit [Streptomyces zingiberis]|uniref:Acyl-CoA carboxylase subunit epsilon n=1 Tax=Streptomyces zingiberis TaxID=2053010 RepID=A0ABX1C301_9ACTN|nr:acyl-CoA carboxylase epsilon subunit [Streptomyces zingiberis]NJQ02998.1 acyl-CoA carboxylase subunit epsilon [Streptomyces zingiberis]
MNAATATLPRTAEADFLRVEKGHAGPEELAALTAVLLARATAPERHERRPGGSRPHRTAPRWHRPERVPAFRAPHSWQG